MKKLIILSRDVVCLADDWTHHYLHKFEIESDWKINEILKSITDSGYLPLVSGTVTWSVSTERPIAVIAQNRLEPILLVSEEFPFISGIRGTTYNLTRLHFNYHLEEDPETVARVLLRYNPCEGW
jgi:hypothetical protein